MIFHRLNNGSNIFVLFLGWAKYLIFTKYSVLSVDFMSKCEELLFVFVFSNVLL